VAVTPAAESDPIAVAGSPWDDRLRLDASGLLPAVVQDASTGQVLMLAWMDREALRRIVDTRRATYWSRSRRTYWVKGETSGNTQHVRQVRLDCDGDTLLLVVDQTGPACHTGADTCFDDAPLLDDPGSDG
jgi:phosphoribosyl-AMP cyclohydrolase